MKLLEQIRAAVAIILGSIHQRLGASLVVVVGIAGVVGVLVTVLALGQGFQRTLSSTGRPDRAIVTSKDAFAESMSSLGRDVVFAVMDAPGVNRNAAGKPIISAEVLTQLQLPSINSGMVKNVSLRGIGPLAMALRPEIHVVQGRMFTPGLHEVIVGVPLQAQFKGIAVGDHLSIQNGDWTIVGSFATTGGGAHDSEILSDSQTLLSAFHRNDFQSITVRLNNRAAFKAFSRALTTNPAIKVDIRREDQYFLLQSVGITRLLTIIGYFVGSIMAVGAIFAALNTMYAAVSAQWIQIATLRAIGFDALAVLVAVYLESLLLAVIGALLGTVVAWLLFNGASLSMLAFGTQSQLVFAIRITPQLAIFGTIWAAGIGFLGGLLPAVRAARLPVAAALCAS